MAKVASEEDRPSERRMTFFEHIEELRQRLRMIVIVVVALFIVNLTTSIGAVGIGSTQVPMLLPALGPTSPNIATQFFIAMKNFLVPARVGPVPLNFSFKEPTNPRGVKRHLQRSFSSKPRYSTQVRDFKS